MMFGLLLAQDRRHSSALPHLRLALAHTPGDPGLRETLATCLIELGDSQEAVVHLRQILAQDSTNANVRFNLGRALLDMQNFVEAERVYAAFVADHPGDAEGFNHLGLARLGMGDPGAAERCFRAALGLHAGDPLFHGNLAQCLSDQARPAEAELAFVEALRLDPEAAGIRCQLGWFKITQGDLQAAQAAFEAALARRPSDVSAGAGLATVYERRGDLRGASEALAPHLDAAPAHPRVAMCFARVSKQLGQPEAALAVVRRALEPALPKHQEAGLRFAEGDVLDAMGEADAAFEAYRRANQAQGLQYDPGAHRELVDRLIMTFTPQFLAGAPKAQQDTSASVMVVGMPRSGTSLVEQILSTHPEVYGAGELDDLATMAQGLPSFLPGDASYPECMNQVNQDLLDELTFARMQSLRRASDAALVVDKTPMNFLHLGLASMVSPDAKIIHCVRNPVDTCLSCFFEHFGGPHYAFSTELESLASFYRQYDRLMKHWSRVLPLQVMTVRYEQLVEDPEGMSRRLLDFLGVDWAPEVLRFHENQRTVRTSSYAEVRRPIYRTSVGRAERYAHRLGPLMMLPSRQA
jgi:tetratricopeptide (TPR) repeat protein